MTEPQEPGFELLAQPARRRHGRLIASVAAVLVLGAGGAVTYAALAADSSGSSSPKAAVQQVVTDLEHSDLIGVLDDLAPGERDALSAPIRDDVAALERLGVVSQGADLSKVSGIEFTTHDLTYAADTITVNDHVQLVQITGGSVELSAAARTFPLTQRFLDLSHAPAKADSTHAAIKHVIRIAAEKVGDGWYASLFYTVADESAGHRIPTAADRIPAAGADSPEGAVEKMVRAVIAGDTRAAVALVSPAELAALHDYGAMLSGRAPGLGTGSATLDSLDLSTAPIAGGGVRVGLKRLVIGHDGQHVSIAVDNGCLSVASGAVHRKICAADAATAISGVLGGLSCATGGLRQDYVTPGGGSAYRSRLHFMPSGPCTGPHFTDAQRHALGHLFTGLLSVGVVSTQVDGQWFVAPVRTAADVGATMLSALEGNDIFELAKLLGAS